MARNSLPYKVECKSSYPFFELIAAFNVETAATAYAGECALANANTNYEYRVVHGRTRVVIEEYKR